MGQGREGGFVRRGAAKHCILQRHAEAHDPDFWARGQIRFFEEFQLDQGDKWRTEEDSNPRPLDS